MPTTALSRDRRRLERIAVAAILAFGVILRTIQYLANGSLWLDELAIAINVSERSLAELMLEPARILALALFALPAAAVILLAPPPYRAEESRSVLAKLGVRWRPGDAIYVYGTAGLAMRFYGPRVEWIRGGVHHGNTRRYFRELDAFRGRPRV